MADIIGSPIIGPVTIPSLLGAGIIPAEAGGIRVHESTLTTWEDGGGETAFVNPENAAQVDELRSTASGIASLDTCKLTGRQLSNPLPAGSLCYGMGVVFVGHAGENNTQMDLFVVVNGSAKLALPGLLPLSESELSCGGEGDVLGFESPIPAEDLNSATTGVNLQIIPEEDDAFVSVNCGAIFRFWILEA